MRVAVRAAAGANTHAVACRAAGCSARGRVTGRRAVQLRWSGERERIREESVAVADPPIRPDDICLLMGGDVVGLRSRQGKRAMIELDAAGDGRFAAYKDFTVAPGGSLEHRLPDWLNAYWLRTVSAQAGKVSAQLTYE